MMKRVQQSLWLVFLCAAVLLAASVASADGERGAIARLNAGAAALEWLPQGEHPRMVLTVSGPEGQNIRQEFAAGKVPMLSLFDAAGQRLPEGSYTWELRTVPSVDPQVRARLAEARRTGNQAIISELKAAGKLPEGQVQSGSFAIAGGAFVIAGLTEGEDRPRNQTAASTGGVRNVTAEDQVIPDDLIVQQSLCVGFDCVNNESFGFDTIRLKENNTRIKFEDTSTGTFPTNDWQLTANDSASGGSSKFSIEDITGARVPFTITAGASTNSIFVDSTGRVGLRTSTPVLDLHINTSNTPAIRLEQNNSGGFTAQTWDIGANEANFFVRDVTGGSKLSFRIRPGAPTSSVDISSDGDVGIGTGSPEAKLHVFCSATSDCTIGAGPNPDGSPGTEGAFNFLYAGATGLRGAGIIHSRGDSNATAPNPSVRFWVANTERMIIDNQGFIGLGGVGNPANPIEHLSGAILTAGGSWQSVSSRASKQDIAELAADEAKATLQGLEPIKFAYKADPKERHVGFIAEEVPDLVASPDRKTMSAMDVVAVLTKVVQEQQKTIDELSAKVAELEKEK